MEKQRRKREKRTEVGERNQGWNKKKNIYIYIYIFFLEYCYSTILKLELYCSTIAKIFAILGFTIF